MSVIIPQDEMSPEERRGLIAELRESIAKAQDGDEDAIANMERSLEQIPSLARKFGSLNLLVDEGFTERATATIRLRRSLSP